MKSFLLVLLFTGFISTSFSQTPNWIWADFGTPAGYNEYCTGIVADTSGGFYVSGRSGSGFTLGGGTIGGGTVPFVGRFDANGNAIWVQTHTIIGGDYPYGLCRDNSNKLYQTGCGGSGNSIYIESYNTSGTFRWAQSWNGGNCCGYGVTADNFGNVYGTGDYNKNGTVMGSASLLNPNANEWSGYLVKLDSATGNVKWGTYFASNLYTVGRGVVTDNAGNVYVCGGYQGTPTFYSANNGPSMTAPAATGFSNFFIAKYDSTGTIQWVTYATNSGINTNDWSYRNSITIDSCNNLYVVGMFSGTALFGNTSINSAGSNDVFVAKYNKYGQWEWVETGGGSGDDRGGGITLDKNSDVYIAGTFAGGSATFSSVNVTGGCSFVAKYANSTGALIWVQSAGTNTQGMGAVAVDKQKYVYVAGGYNGGVATFGSAAINGTDNSTGANLACVMAKLDTVPPRTIVPTVQSSYCPGSSTTISYSITGTFNAGNVFTAQLSNDSGSFISPVNLGDTTTTAGGNINITIPSNTPPGTDYLIRVISSNPATSSYVNGCGAYFANNVYVNISPVTIGGGSVTAKVSNDTSICYGSLVQLHASGGTSYSWSPGATLNDTTSANPIAAPTSPQIYTVIVSSGACGSDTAKVTVNVTPKANVSVTPGDTSICSGMSATLHASGATTYLWTPGVTLSDSSSANPVATPLSSITYSVIGGSCSNVFTVTVNVGNVALGGKVNAVRDTICAGTPGNLTLTGNSSNTLQWQSSADDINFTNAGDTATKYKTSPLAQTTFYRAIVGAGNCSATSDTLELYVPPALIASFYSTQTSPDNLSFNSDSSSGKIRSYHWDFGDGGTSTDSNPSHTYTKDSTYYVCLTLYDGSNCSYTFCRYSEVTDGVLTISAAGNWLIYPNPFSEQLIVSSKHGSSHIRSIEMYDMLGQLVINRNFDNTTNTSLQLDVSLLAKGMYYIMIKTANADYVQKVVKQ